MRRGIGPDDTGLAGSQQQRTGRPADLDQPFTGMHLCRTVLLHLHGVFRATNADRRHSGADLVVVAVRASDEAGNGAQTALEQAEEAFFLAVFLAGELVVVDTELTPRLQGNQRTVAKTHLGAAAVGRADGVAITDFCPLGERAFTRRTDGSHPAGGKIDTGSTRCLGQRRVGRQQGGHQQRITQTEKGMGRHVLHPRVQKS